ncbi:unnamed protein product, partial [marine sediment metagenome]
MSNMYKYFEQKVAKKAIKGFHWWCKACSSPAMEYSELCMIENSWKITRIRCASCLQVWKRPDD